MTVSKELLAILVCPKCKGELRFEEAVPRLVCGACRLAYAIRDDIPIMLVDEAAPLENAGGTKG
jgi:uncharacterized protein